MPRYRIIDQPTYIGGTMRQPDEVVDYAGWPGSTMEPDEPIAQRVKDFYVEARKRRRKLERTPDLAQFAKASAKEKPDE